MNGPRNIGLRRLSREALEARVVRLEAVAEAARPFVWGKPLDTLLPHGKELKKALAALDGED